MLRKRTPLEIDARRAEIGWRMWWALSHALTGCPRCLDAMLSEGPLHG